MKFISRSICAASVCAVLAGLCTSAQAWDKWDAFKAANVNDSFRVVDYSDNRRITTSEGQSYPMFFALVAAVPVFFSMGSPPFSVLYQIISTYASI